MSTPRSNPRSNSRTRINRVLWQWLIAGASIWLLVPAARGYDPLLGWLGYWLLAAPTIALITLHRQRWWPRPQPYTRTRAAPNVVRLPRARRGVNTSLRHAA